VEMEVSNTGLFNATYVKIISIRVVINLDLPIRNDGKAPKLCLKIEAVSDGSKADLNEAITQARRKDIKALPSISANAAQAIESADAFVQRIIPFAETWEPILQRLQAFQDIGNYVSEVNPFSASFTLEIIHPVM
jgi:hypothetical protein